MRSIKFIITAFVVMLAVVTVSAQSLNDVKAKYNEAAGLIQEKKFQQAIPALESVIDMGLEVAEAADIVTQSQKLLPDCYFQYALSLCKEGKFRDAIPVIEQTMQIGELYGNTKVARNSRQLMSQAYMALGAEYFNKKDYSKAIEEFSKGYEVNPTDTQLALYLAESYAENGDYENGFKIYEEIAALEARHSRYKAPADQAREKIQYYLTIEASNVAQSGNTTEAYRLLDELLEKDPSNAYAYMTKIQVATNAEQWNRVIQWGDVAANAQTEADKKSDIYYYVAAAYQNSENYPKAIEYYAKVTGNKAEAAKAQIEALRAIKQ